MIDLRELFPDLPPLTGTSIDKLNTAVAAVREADVGLAQKLFINGALAMPAIAGALDDLQRLEPHDLDELLEQAAAHSGDFIRQFRSDAADDPERAQRNVQDGQTCTLCGRRGRMVRLERVSDGATVLDWRCLGKDCAP